MKVKYYYIGIFLLLIIIFIFFYQTQKTSKCDANTTKSIILLEDPISLKIVKNDEVYLEIFINNINKRYIASSMVKNFFRNVSPLCSNTIYKINTDYFKHSVCFKGEDYEICRGEKLLKGYPIAIKKQDIYSDLMYFIDSYPWESIETTLQKIKSSKNREEVLEHIVRLIDKKLLTLPERSFVSSIWLQSHSENFRLQQIQKHQWQVNEKQIPSHLVSSFINALLMLEEDVIFQDLPDKSQMEVLLQMEITLDFEELKFSLFQNKTYKIKFFVLRFFKDFEYYMEFNNQLKKIKKEKFLSLEDNLNTLIQSLKNNEIK